MVAAPPLRRLTTAQIWMLPQRWTGHVQVVRWIRGQPIVQYDGPRTLLTAHDNVGQITHITVESWLELFFALQHQLHPDGWLVGLTCCVALYDAAGGGPPYALPGARPVWRLSGAPISDLALCAAELAAHVRFLAEQNPPPESRSPDDRRLAYDMTLAKIAFLADVSVLELNARVRKQHPHLFPGE